MADAPHPGRLHRLRPGALDSAQRALYDSITGGPRASGVQHFRLVDDEGGLEGPFNAFLLQPALGDRLQALGSAIRYSTSLSPRRRELAILIVAAAWCSEFEQHAHEPIARAAGITDDELAAVRAGAVDDTPANWLDPDDLLLVRTVRSLVEHGDLDDEEYRHAVDGLGHAALFELLTLVGYYATLALQLRVFRVHAPLTALPSTLPSTSESRPT